MRKAKAGFDHAKLRSIMAEREITNEKLAKMLRKNKGTISLWKRGRSRPTLTDLGRLGEKLKMDYKIFLT